MSIRLMVTGAVWIQANDMQAMRESRSEIGPRVALLKPRPLECLSLDTWNDMGDAEVRSGAVNRSWHTKSAIHPL